MVVDGIGDGLDMYTDGDNRMMLRLRDQTLTSAPNSSSLGTDGMDPRATRRVSSSLYVMDGKC